MRKGRTRLLIPSPHSSSRSLCADPTSSPPAMFRSFASRKAPLLAAAVAAAAGVQLYRSRSVAYASPASPSSATATPAAAVPLPIASAVPAPATLGGHEDGAPNYDVNLDLHRPFPARPAHLTVRGLVVVHRHGARAPISFLPGGGPDAPDATPGSEEALKARKEQFARLWGQCSLPDGSLIPCQRGLLTQLGELQLGSVGYWLRRRYATADEFLPSRFDADPSFFALRSTDLPRTQLSLMRLMQGMYPGLDSATLARAIEVRKQRDETLYPNHYHCPRLHELYVESCHASHAEEADSPAAAYKALADSPDAQALRERFAQALRTPAKDLGTWVVIGDELKCRQGERLPQEVGVTQAMSDAANRLAEDTFWHILRGGASPEHAARRPKHPNSTDVLETPKAPREAEVVKLGMGRLLAEVFGALDRIKDVHESGTAASTTGATPAATGADAVSSLPPRCLVLSGHDTTVGPLMSALHATHAFLPEVADAKRDARGPGWPVFGCNIVLELLESTAAPAPADSDAPHAVKPLPAHLSLRDSLAPLPPMATDDEEHHLPKQNKDDDAVAAPAAVAKEDSFSPHASGATPWPASSGKAAKTGSAAAAPASSSRWYLRMLVDQREVALLPYDAYRSVREAYTVKDWAKECLKHRKEDLPTHRW